MNLGYMPILNVPCVCDEGWMDGCRTLGSDVPLKHLDPVVAQGSCSQSSISVGVYKGCIVLVATVCCITRPYAGFSLPYEVSCGSQMHNACVYDLNCWMSRPQIR